MGWLRRLREQRRIMDDYGCFVVKFEAAMEARRRAILPSDIKAAEDSIKKSVRYLRVRYLWLRSGQVS